MVGPAILAAAVAFTVAAPPQIPAASLARAERAIEAQSRVVARRWDTGPATFVPTGGIPVTIQTTPLVAPAGWALEPGDGGFHTAGPVEAFVEYSADWTVTLDHEVLETLVDPSADEQYYGQLQEICDPVANVSYTGLGGVALSDFVYPSWFRAGSRGPWDYAGAATRAGDAFHGADPS